MPGWHIGVSGLMGSGKTTLVRALAGELGGEALQERDADNPYLADFYEKPKDWAFKSFVFFLGQTLGDYNRARAGSTGAVQERVLEEHLLVFGQEFHRRGYLSDDELRVLAELTATAVDLVSSPDLLIHLDVEPAEALRRLRQRANATEGGIEPEYLEALNGRYAQLLAAWPGDVLRLDANSYDFRQPDQVTELAAVVRDRLAGVGVG